MTGKKAFQQVSDSNNELYHQIYDMLGAGVVLPTFNIENDIKKGYLINPHIYTVINKKIQPAAKVPFYLYEEKPDKRKEAGRYKSALRQGNIEQAEFYLGKAYDMVEIAGITELLQNPNENESFTEWLESLLGNYNLTGNGYVYGLQPDSFEHFSKIYTMPSQMTRIVTGPNWREPIQGYEVNWFGMGLNPIQREHVCHIKKWNPDTYRMDRGLYGLSPMSPLCRVQKNSNDNFMAQMRLLEHGYPAGVLSGDSERAMTSEQAEIMYKKFEEKFGGENQKKIMLTSAAVKWQALGLNSVDLQLLDADKANLDTIARVYGVPTPLVNDTHSTMDNMKVSALALWNNAIIPDLARVRDDVFNKWLLAYWKKKTRRKLYIDYDLMTVEDLKKDEKQIVERLAMEIENGMLTPNQAIEIRGRELGKDPLLDKYYLKQGLRPIDQPHTPANTQNNGTGKQD